MKRITLLLLVQISLWTCLRAQFVHEQTIYRGIDPPEKIFAAADFDGDGDADFLGTTGWLERDSENSFSEYHTWDNTYELASAFVADFDGDGDMDVLGNVGQIFTQILVLLENDGTGNLSVTAPGGETVVGIGDIDGDGDMDAFQYIEVFGDNSPKEISWLRNEGGSFSNQSSLGFSCLTQSNSLLDVKDIDGDGDVDCACQSENKIRIFLNNDMQFEQQLSIDFPDSLKDPRGVFGYFDDNSILDIIYVDPNASNSAQILPGNGDGTFDEPISAILGKIPAGRACLGDFNADEKTDILFLDGLDTFIQFSNGLNSFPADFNENLAFFEEHTTVLNVDEDIAMEVVNIGTLFKKVQVLDLQTDESPFTVFQSLGVEITDIESYDYDKDGDEDLLALSYNRGLLFFQNDMEQFQPPELLWSNVKCSEMCIFDIEGDGTDEIVVSNSGSPHVKILRPDDNGVLQYDEAVDITHNIEEILYPLDIDGDGNQDIISFDERLQVSYGTGQAFEEPQEIFTELQEIGAHQLFAKFLDWDLDGDLDLLAPKENLELGLYYYEYLGNRSYASGVELVSLVDRAIDFADLDQDGDQDLLAKLEGDSGFAIYLNNDGELVQHATIPDFTAPLQPTTHLLLDFDNDGHIDLFDEGSLCKNDGSGNLETTNVLSYLTYTNFLTAIDYNQDSLADIVYFDAGAIELYQNQLAGSESVAIQNATGNDDFILSPNPASNTILISSESLEECSFRIVSINGSDKREGILAANRTIDVSSLQKGLYILHLESQELSSKKLFFKQ